MRTVSGLANKALEAIAKLARDEFEDPNDQVWLKQLLVDAYHNGYDAGQEDTLADLSSYASAVHSMRMINSTRNLENQEKWDRLTETEKAGHRRMVLEHKAMIAKGRGK